MRPLVLLPCLLLACRDGGPVALDPSELSVSPAALAFDDTYLSFPRTAPLEVSNRSGATADVELTVDAPFNIAPASLRLTRGESRSVDVTFAPQQLGRVEVTLHVGPLEVPLSGVGVAVPECAAPAACTDAHFDPNAAQCITATLADGVSCQTSCITSGACRGGACSGAPRDCSDHDLCTADVCSETDGCVHPPIECPRPSNPCQVPTCDSATGCGVAAADDGVLCGPDDCLQTTVNVCIAGACVQRVRPDTARCANRWVAAQLPSNNVTAMAFDAETGRLMIFGGADTWELLGTRWSQRRPPASPPAMFGSMAYDSGRKRMVLVGEAASTLQTWEWDGSTWLDRTPVSPLGVSPPPMRGGLAYDPDRRRTVLVGELDTWEWDGSTWSRVAAMAPVAAGTLSLTFDGDRHRVVAAVTDDQNRLGIWELVGAQWTQQNLPHQPVVVGIDPLIAWDAARHRLVLLSGFLGSAAPVSTWESDGQQWIEVPNGPSRPLSEVMTFDGARGRVVSVNLATGSTLEWDGTHWLTIAAPQPWCENAAMTWDPQKQVVLLACCIPPRFETWEFDGREWRHQAPPQSPPVRRDTALAWDEIRNRAVLFGGSNPAGGNFGDTWEWDGATWRERVTGKSPPARARHTLVYDAARRRTMLFGGYDDVWEWDGSVWRETGVTRFSLGFYSSSAAFDAVHGQVVYIASSETEVWDGAQWVGYMSPPPIFPPASVTWDSHRRRIVSAIGMFSGGLATWEWDGATWSDRHPITPPNLPAIGAMAYDPVRDQQVYFGGSSTWLLLP